MAKNKKQRKKSGARKHYGTPLEGHVRHKKLLKPPLMMIDNFQFTSWVNRVLANVLWSALIASLLPRDKAIATFRVILTRYKDQHAEMGDIMLEHSEFAGLADDLFNSLFGELCSDVELRDALLPLLLIESLPDAAHWKRCLAMSPDPEREGTNLMRAVGECYDHQSQAATDCRWVRVMTLVAQDKMRLPEERMRELIEYPSRGDMRAVRPFIRATEIATRNMFEIEMPDKPVYAEEFWSECFSKTPCIPRFPDEDAVVEKYDELFETVAKTYRELSDHFLA